jgi:hypothetical protein
MSWWEWVADFARCAAEAGDAQRQRLVALLHEAYGHRERDPGRFLALCEEGRRLAQRLREPWWDLYFRAAVVHQLVHFNRDFRTALDRAVAAVLEARKPLYDGCPCRNELYQDLLAVQFCTDPDGHADAIEEGFRDLEDRIAADLSSRLHLLNLRRWCAEQRRRPEEHFAAAQRVLALLADAPGHYAALHYSTFVYNGLCRVYRVREEWQELGEAARLAEEASRRVRNEVELALSCLWQALAAWHAGDERRSLRLRRRGVRSMTGLGVPPPDAYFEALSLCHEQAGQVADALAVRDRELALLESQGRTISEVYCHRERCRLLAALGRLRAADLDVARAAARRLRFAEAHLAELERLGG